MTVSAADLERASALILNGEIVAIPTETVYGLAADATNDRAVARVYAAKGRPSFNPLIIHVADAAMASAHVAIPPVAEKLADAFWPGPLTLVLTRKKESAISLLAGAGLDSLGLRAPDNAIAQALIAACARPLAAPSANRSGKISPTTAERVRDSLGDAVPMILDGGRCRIGVESTVVKIVGDEAILLRPGGASRADIERVIGAPLASPAVSAIEAPGMLATHYAPQARLRLNVVRPEDGEAFLAFGTAVDHPYSLNLSEKGDLVEAASNLFAHLSALDATCAERGLDRIATAPVPNVGLGEAINDRLRRAAAPKD